MLRERVCTTCNEVKPISQFHRTSRKYKNKDGIRIYKYYHSKCRDCRMLQRKEWGVKRDSILQKEKNVKGKDC